MSPHHSLDSASMSPVYYNNLQHQQAARTPSHHHKSVTLGAMDWPHGHSRGGEGRRGDWQGGGQLAMGVGMQEAGGVEALQRRLRIDVNSPVRLLSESVCLSVYLSVCLSVHLSWLADARLYECNTKAHHLCCNIDNPCQVIALNSSYLLACLSEQSPSLHTTCIQAEL